MRYKIYIILSLLIVALLIQNTCPQGFAGKSTVAASCSRCPQMQVHTPPPENGLVSTASHPTARLPMYVLDIPSTQHLFRLMSIASPQPVIPSIYENNTPDELLPPPRA